MPSGILRKITTKFKPSQSPPKSANLALESPRSPLSPTRRTGVPEAPDDLVARRRRQAALQKCGLTPTKDLSRLEQELDELSTYVVVPPQDRPEQGELSTAEKIIREWQAKNEGLPVEQGGPGSTGPRGVTSDLAEDQKTTKVTSPTSPRTVPNPARPASLCSIPEVFLFPDIPEEDDTAPGIEKVPLILFQLLPSIDS